MGRGDHNDVAIHDESVSESHAKIQRREDAWYIVDMDSTNGTYVSGNRVFGEATVTSGADLRFGGVKMLFRTAGGAQRTMSRHVAPLSVWSSGPSTATSASSVLASVTRARASSATARRSSRA